MEALRVISPFVENESYIVFKDWVGYQQKWLFRNGGLIVIDPVVTFPEDNYPPVSSNVAYKLLYRLYDLLDKPDKGTEGVAADEVGLTNNEIEAVLKGRPVNDKIAEELIQENIEKMSPEELLPVWNRYCFEIDRNLDKVFPMKDFERYTAGLSLFAAFKKKSEKFFDENDDFFSFGTEYFRSYKAGDIKRMIYDNSADIAKFAVLHRNGRGCKMIDNVFDECKIF